MIGYAVKQDGSWRCIDTESMPLNDGETFQEEMPEVTAQEVMP